MRRLAVALVVLAAILGTISSGTFALFTATSSNSSTVHTATTLLPVNLSSTITITGSAGSGYSISDPLTGSPVRWGYNAPSGGVVDRSGELTISVTDQWQFCTALGDLSTCANLPGVTGTSLPTSSLTALQITALGAGAAVRVVETASNTLGSATAITSGVAH